MYIHIDTMYKIDDYREHAIQRRELYLMHGGDLNKKEVQKGGSMCICVCVCVASSFLLYGRN